MVRFPGSLDHDSAARAVEGLGATSVEAWHADTELPPGTDAVLLPGGFSYGDHLRCGAIASRAPIMAAVRRHAEAGGRVVGICNGFQVLCEAGPAAGRAAPQRHPLVRVPPDGARGGRPGHAVDVGAARRARRISIPVKNNEGAWYGDPAAARVVLRYRDNLLGSTDAVAGVANAAGNVMGLMPHPEEACDALLGSTDGRLVLAAGLVAAMSTDRVPRHRQLGLTDDEAARIPELLGRAPSDPELVMFSLMWSEHCSYKHSQAPAARASPRRGPRVLQGPGENAGVVDVGDGIAVALKIESHNHPSAVEPFEGAATGVGGIVRDIIAMGARPIALLDSLRFGELSSARSRHLFTRSVAGIGHYGNCIGVPTVGGEVSFDDRYEESCLVNAMCVGVLGPGRDPARGGLGGRATRWC